MTGAAADRRARLRSPRRCFRGGPAVPRTSLRRGPRGRSRGRGRGRRDASSRAALSSSGGASLPRRAANAIWARSRSTPARSVPAPARSSSVSASSSAPAWNLVCGCGERALRAPRCFGGQRGGALEKRAGGRETAARLGALGGAFELACDRLVGTRGGLGEMPGTAVGIGPVVGCPGQRIVGVAASLRGRRAIQRRAHERVPEHDPAVDLDQPGRFGRLQRAAVDPQLVGRAPEQRRIAGRLRGGQQQQPPGVLGQRLQAVAKALLDPPRQPRAAGQSRRPAGPAKARAAAPTVPAGSRASRR